MEKVLVHKREGMGSAESPGSAVPLTAGEQVQAEVVKTQKEAIRAEDRARGICYLPNQTTAMQKGQQ